MRKFTHFPYDFRPLYHCLGRTFVPLGQQAPRAGQKPPGESSLEPDPQANYLAHNSVRSRFGSKMSCWCKFLQSANCHRSQRPAHRWFWLVATCQCRTKVDSQSSKGRTVLNDY